ncbi:MAG: BsuBI/PstI family type II restriction endonuclease [Oscillospiraceae bacterium]
MNKLNEARVLLELIGMPKPQQSDICCYTLLALTDLTEIKPWNTATCEWIRIHDIMVFIAEEYNIKYAENSRETFRKQALHQFRTAALIEDNGLSTNSPNYRYRITDEALNLIRSFNSAYWAGNLATFLFNHETLIFKYSSKKKMEKMPVLINGCEFTFSPGPHNDLQKKIIEEFAPRFAHNCECLYVGDTIKKDIVKDIAKLSLLGINITLHDKMPDVVLYREDKDWMYFIESVTSVGPMDPKRICELTELTKNVSSGKIFITAFLDFKTFKKFAETLAWETEVWVADMPDHMIHLNGDRFMGPR